MMNRAAYGYVLYLDRRAQSDGQHGVYCSSARNPEVPALDLQKVNTSINGAKQRIGSVMEKLRLEKEAAE
jgi:hypothetical protein